MTKTKKKREIQRQGKRERDSDEQYNLHWIGWLAFFLPVLHRKPANPAHKERKHKPERRNVCSDE